VSGSDDRDALGGVSRRHGGGKCRGKNDLDFQPDEIRSKVRQLLQLFPSEAVLQGDILALNPAKLAQTSSECLDEEIGGASAQNPDPGNPIRLLGGASERRYQEGESQQNGGW